MSIISKVIDSFLPKENLKSVDQEVEKINRETLNMVSNTEVKIYRLNDELSKMLKNKQVFSDISLNSEKAAKTLVDTVRDSGVKST